MVLFKTKNILFRWATLNYEFFVGLWRRYHRKNHQHAGVQDVCNHADVAFVLSTGRCGTSLLSRVLSYSPDLYVTHKTNHAALSAYRYQCSSMNESALRLMALAAYFEPISEAYFQGLMYVDTNAKLVFFAPELAKVFPRARFIHLVRHPGDFARSGCRRGYYERLVPCAHGHIEPCPDDPLSKKWHDMNQLEKIAWQWNETNRFIENMKNSVTSERFLTIRAEDFFTDPEVSATVFCFLQAKGISLNKINKIISRPLNEQKSGTFPEYSDWDEIQKAHFVQHASLMNAYGYKL